jgi:dipeptidyl aminopeptidase/acylaminoacyl peptidase
MTLETNRRIFPRASGPWPDTRSMMVSLLMLLGAFVAQGVPAASNAPASLPAPATPGLPTVPGASGATGSPAAPGASAVPLSVYGNLPNLEEAALSPDGTRIAYVRTEGNLRVVVVATVADRKMIRWVRVGEEKLRSIRWADDDNVMLFTSVTTASFGFKEEWSMLRVYNVARNEVRSLPANQVAADDHFLNTVIGPVAVRRVDGHTVLFVPGVYINQGRGVALFRCDLTAGTTAIVRTSTGDTYWLVDSQGQIAAERVYDEQTHRWVIHALSGGSSPRELASGHAALDAPELLGFGPTSDTLLVDSVENSEYVWKLLSISDGKPAALPEGAPYDESIKDPFTDRLIGGVQLGDRRDYVFFDSAMQSRWKSIVEAFDGDQVEYESASQDLSKVLVRVEGPKYGLRYVLVDLQKPSATLVGKVYAGIDNPLQVRAVTYAAADGLEIRGYLTLPRGRPPHDLPLIVLPHGGPAARDTAEFDWWSQALAQQGYAVLQPNFRGSTVTQKLLEAGYGQWGRKMQTDLSDGVRYLVKEGIADGARVCIVGASYGGYAALAGVTLDPTTYRCAVAVAGISDLSRMLEWEGRGGLDARDVARYWDRFWGVSGRTDPVLESISPIKHVDAVKAPVLLIHGRDDVVVPFEQSQLMYDALRREKKDAQLVVLKKEDHWLSRGETRLQMLEATVAFLRAHNPPD